MSRGRQMRMQTCGLAPRHHVLILSNDSGYAAAALLAALRLSIAARDE